MLNSMLMFLNSIIGLILIVLATNVNKNLSKCKPSQKLINCLQGLTIIGTIMFIIGLSFLLASYKCRGCGDLVMPSLYITIAFYFILGIILITLAAIIKKEDSSNSCSSGSLTMPIIILGVIMLVAALGLIIFLLKYGRAVMKVKNGVDQANAVVLAVNEVVASGNEEAPVAPAPVAPAPVAPASEQSSAFSSCRFSRRRHH